MLQAAVSVTLVPRWMGLGTDGVIVHVAGCTTSVAGAGCEAPVALAATTEYAWLPAARGVTTSVGDACTIVEPSGAVKRYSVGVPRPLH